MACPSHGDRGDSDDDHSDDGRNHRHDEISASMVSRVEADRPASQARNAADEVSEGLGHGAGHGSMPIDSVGAPDRRQIAGDAGNGTRGASTRNGHHLGRREDRRP